MKENSIENLALFELLENPDFMEWMDENESALSKTGLNGIFSDEEVGNEVVEEIKKQVAEMIAEKGFLRESKRKFLEGCENDFEDRFGEVVDKILSEAEVKGGLENVEGFVGKGKDGSVFKIEIDGQNYALKIFKSFNSVIQARAMMAAGDLNNVVRFEGFSLRRNMMVMNFVEGKCWLNMTREDLAAVTRKHCEDLMELLKNLYERGIFVDPMASNLIFDPRFGFQIVDLELFGETEEGIDFIVEVLTDEIFTGTQEIDFEMAYRLADMFTEARKSKGL